MIDLAGSIFSVGRRGPSGTADTGSPVGSNNLCCASLNIEPKLSNLFSEVHFILSKNVNDIHSPVFIEVSRSALIFSRDIFLHFFIFSILGFIT